MRSSVRSVLVVSGLLGAIVGFCHPALQDAVEVAQIHAGVVTHHETHPLAPLAMRLWSLQVQVPALFLHWGASERSSLASPKAAQVC